ncbi:Histone-lysine N-methyltransferase PRDM9 [Daphnia sinensis]|uniref:Histone-lysine N-methyltransferase PRDM9 n=1 Tax=Daphnia sinensis TaxID=1820382 RepID=A0AAD5LAQ3_9CRUS|nr:Histone-lysine N-methyltransferase PRDM9 [Daphnia sinensis]
MEKQEPNYALRPRRSTAKGKYREMLGISQYHESDPTIRVETVSNDLSSDDGNKGCKIFLLPLVVSGESDILADNTIEIEISEDVCVSELPEAVYVNEDEQRATELARTHENPLKHIEEILKKNDQLIESIPEPPSFKKHGKHVKEEKCPESDERLLSTSSQIVKTAIEDAIESDEYGKEEDYEISIDPSLYQNPTKSQLTRKNTKNQSSERGDSGEDGDEGKETNCEPFVCDICGKTLKHQKSLYSHRRTHTDAKAVCHICGATLKSSRYLHHHLLLHKDVEKPHKCDKCGKSFFSSSALKVHHYYNHEEHPGRFQCTVCGKNFKAKQGLQFHMDSHSNELRYECSYCHKRFRGFKTCRVHELRHREANEPNKFNCSICGKLFKTRQTLKNHEDVHASFNRYQCSLCEKRFKLRKSCLAHIRVHHTDHERLETQHATVPDEGEVAIESLLADGEEYVVTLEEAPEVEGVLLEEGQEETMEIIVPDADVECEVENVS